MTLFKDKYGVAWYALLLLAMAALSVWFYHDVIAGMPSHIHAWTQSDRYALALGFVDNGLNFFKPQTLNVFTPEGITAVDFPIHEYIVAILMKLLGTTDPVVFRGYTLIYCLAGYSFFFGLAYKLTKSGLRAFLATLFVFCCPILVYYQAGFIPSITSFSSALIGYAFYFSYLQSGRIRHFYWAIVMLLLAALPRLSCHILLFAVLVHRMWYYFRSGNWPRKEIRTLGVAYLVALVAVLWKTHLADAYGSRFLTNLMPARGSDEFFDIVPEVASRWTFQLFTEYHYLALAALLGWTIYRLIGRKNVEQMDRDLGLQSGLLLAGSAVFFVLLARQFVAHEYYFIDSLYPAICLLILLGIRAVRPDRYVSRLGWIAFFLACLVGALTDTQAVQMEKYAETLWDRGEITRKNFEGADDLLDTLEIPKDARMLVFEAYSTNAPLIAMQRRGYTILNSTEANIARALDLEFDYIVVQDVFFPSQVIYNYPGLLDQIERVGGNGRISVFRTSTAGTASTGKALGIDRLVMRSTLRYDSVESTGFWSNISHLDTSLEDPAGFVDPGIEFGPTFTIPYDEASFNRVLFQGRFRSITDEPQKLQIVGSIDTWGDSKSFYQYHTLDVSPGTDWLTFACLFIPSDGIPTGQDFKCYVWNQYFGEVIFDDLEVTLYQK